MLVTELRQKMLEKVAQVSGQGDEATTATVLAYARAALIALAGHPGDQEVTLQDLTVGTRTAALILTLHPEYVRLLIRTGRLQANKENGEYQIGLAHIAELAAAGTGALGQESQRVARTIEMLGVSTIAWSKPETGVAETGTD